jgi:hypothetical protein
MPLRRARQDDRNRHIIRCIWSSEYQDINFPNKEKEDKRYRAAAHMVRTVAGTREQVGPGPAAAGWPTSRSSVAGRTEQQLLVAAPKVHKTRTYYRNSSRQRVNFAFWSFLQTISANRPLAKHFLKMGQHLGIT